MLIRLRDAYHQPCSPQSWHWPDYKVVVAQSSSITTDIYINDSRVLEIQGWHTVGEIWSQLSDVVLDQGIICQPLTIEPPELTLPLMDPTLC